MYSVKNVKTFKGHDGIGFNASLYFDGKKVADVHDGAYGGEAEFNWVGNRFELMENLKKHCATLPMITFGNGKPFANSPDIFVNELVNDFLLRKTFNIDMKKKIIFIDNAKLYSAKLDYNDLKVQSFMQRKYPNAIILNTLTIEEAFEWYKKLAAA